MKLMPLFLAALLVVPLAATAKHHRQVEVEVIHISEDYGNVDTSGTVETLEELGLMKGNSFPVAFGGTEVMVYLGETYSDVPRGDWVAFVTDQGNIRLARNYENAAATLGVAVGDKVKLFN